MKLELEKLVNAAYRVASPVRSLNTKLDSIVKLGYDALAATAANFGVDRFALARYTAIVTGATFAVAAVTYFVNREVTLSLSATVASIAGFVFSVPAVTSDLRNYFLKPRDSLNKTLEEGVAGMKLLRFPLLAFAFVAPKLIETDSASGPFSNTFFAIGLAGMSSFMYFLDGKPSMWDSATNWAKKTYSAVFPRLKAE